MQELNHFTLQVLPTDSVLNAQFSLGLPLKQGQFYAHQDLKCERADNQPVHCALTPLAFWPDNSIKWVKLNGLTQTSGLNDTHFYICAQQCSHALRKTLLPEVSANDETLTITTPSLTLTLSRKALLTGSIKSGATFTFGVSGDIAEPFQLNQAKLKDWHFVPRYFNSGDGEPDILDVYLTYCLAPRSDNIMPLEFDSKITLYRHSGRTEFTTTLRNPNPAEHNGGTWDLGEPASVMITDFSFMVSTEGTTQLQSGSNSEWHTISSEGKLWQRSSSGVNWDSPNHLNRHHALAVKQKASSINVNGESTESTIRLSPQGLVVNSETTLKFTPANFWQNFPTALSARPGQISWHWFHAEASEPVELQPGEQKTHHCQVQLNSDYVQATAVLNPNWIEACGVLPWFSLQLTKDPLQALINAGIDSDASFFAKREHIDEFGWRHFGDLYADHETAGHTGDELFASHYNNQYDPLLGFLKQWLLSGDPRWKELADNLAQHIIDIDIYHCDTDKPEYNRGLFWHTDHYLPAETATHRTYSKHHKSDAYQDHAGGGGPGGQHCYTTGLQLYYFLTGNLQAKQAVLGLTGWITGVYEGDNTLFGLLLQFKNRYRKDLKNIATGSYPLDRGTANYMNALLDSYEITGNLQLLSQVSYIIKQTISPDDDFSLRELDNIEEHWFYTVFLQAVCRYLEVQRSNGITADYEYAKACLLHYAKWMADNEYSYLKKPEILEYPNQTWTAQDLRKIQVLSVAATFADEQLAQKCVGKASELKQYCIAALQQSDERHYTRILALLMQNYGTDTVLQSTNTDTSTQLPSALPGEILRTSGWLYEVRKVLGQFSVSYEWQQLQKRIPALRRK